MPPHCLPSIPSWAHKGDGEADWCSVTRFFFSSLKEIKIFPVLQGSGRRAQICVKIKTKLHTNIFKSELKRLAPPLDDAAISEREQQQSALCSCRELARMRSTPLGIIQDRMGLSSAVCCKTSSFQQCVNVNSRGGVSSDFRGRNNLSIEQKSNSGGGFYFR